MVARDQRVISPSYTRSYPFVMDHGQGSEVWDVDGDRFIDFTAGVAVLAAGHAHPAIVEADHRAGAALYAHGRHRLLSAGSRGAGRNAVPHHARRLRQAGLLHQLRHRVDRSGDEAVPLSHRPALLHQLPGRVPRAHLRQHVARHQQVAAPHRLPAAAGRHLPRALPEPLPPAVRRADRAPGPRLRRLYREDDAAATWCGPRKWPASSSRPIQGEGGYVIPPRRLLSRPCATSATSTTSRWWWTRCSRAWAAPARCSPSSTGTWCPT